MGGRHERYVCVHGHFYQPPRDNPWLEYVESQDSAWPYHDWNERVTEECYAQNAASRILDENDRIAAIANNYARMSFNIGPTLLAWMEGQAPDVHAAIVAADHESRERFSGHGSALAQAYGHVIMPLASPRDRRTQVAWGIADFVHRFGRRPEGMWLPETAVDLDTLEALAEHDIAFTILEPGQASRVRASGGEWEEVDAASLDTTVACRAVLPSGRDLAVFFYDAPISRAVAFEGLLDDGAVFAARLADAVDQGRSGPQLVHIATDGESYGHHHRHGDMALAFALRRLDESEDVHLTSYGEFLERHPPQHEVEIAENTSWSCAHGVERWRSDCGCADGGHPEWHQAWRAPLRAALDWLRGEIDPRYEAAASEVLKDPWGARDAYISVILDRRETDAFLQRHAAVPLEPEARTRALRLLELQRHAMLMYTSCGWFFDDLARIESVQVLRYAARAAELAESLFDVPVERGFLELLAEAESNRPEEGDGRRIYESRVRPSRLALADVGEHYAVSCLFERYGPRAHIHCYDVTSEDHLELAAGDARLAVGRVEVASVLTEERTRLEFGVVHLGDHNIDGGIRGAGDEEVFRGTRKDLEEAFAVADFPETIRRLDHHFGRGARTTNRFTLKSLFHDEQQRILGLILDESVADARAAYRNIYRTRASLMRYLRRIGARVPRTFHSAAEIAVNDDLRRAFQSEDVDPARVHALLDDAAAWDLELDTVGLALELNRTIEHLTERVREQLPEPRLFERFGEAELGFLQHARTLVELARSLPFEVDLWRAQNLCHDVLRRIGAELRTRSDEGDEVAKAWFEHLRLLSDALEVSVDAVLEP
ncbi:MAG: DUF3536 domain-containing protein [Nitriliruptorales bacterium]